MSEKRQFLRHPSSIPIEVRLLSGGCGSSEVSDISLGGLSFAFHWPVASGVELAVRVLGLAEHIELSGKVVRCERDGRDWLIGIVFDGRDEVFHMRMLQQICHIEDYRRRVMEIDGREISSEVAAEEWVALYAADFLSLGL